MQRCQMNFAATVATEVAFIYVLGIEIALVIGLELGLP